MRSWTRTIVRAYATPTAISHVPLLNPLVDQLGLTPPLGWNTWMTCGDPGCGHDVCNEAEVKGAATAMAANGMQALGYTYVNLVSSPPCESGIVHANACFRCVLKVDV